MAIRRHQVPAAGNAVVFNSAVSVAIQAIPEHPIWGAPLSGWQLTSAVLDTVPIHFVFVPPSY